MNEFSERFKLKTNSELIRIVKNPLDYYEQVVQAAKEELVSRGLSEYNINEFKIREDTKLENDFILTPTVERINRYFQKNTKEDRIISGLIILLSLYAMFGLYAGFELLIFALSKQKISTLIFATILFIPAIAVFLFWKRNKYGWILVCFILSYAVIESIVKYLTAYLYDKDGMAISFVFTLIFGFLLYLISSRKIRSIYGINEKFMGIAIGTALCLSILISIALIN